MCVSAPSRVEREKSIPESISQRDCPCRPCYDLSNNRYREVVHEEVDHRAPQAILDELDNIEKESTQGMSQLRGMLT